MMGIPRCEKCGAGPAGNCGFYGCETPRETCPLPKTGTPTGRIPKGPEMQDLRPYRMVHMDQVGQDQQMISLDYSQVELRVLAQMDADGQAASQVLGFEDHESQANVTPEGDE